MHRSYSAKANFKFSNITISDPQEIHHIQKVLRLKTGDALIIFNANNEQGMGKILSVSPKKVDVQINSFQKIKNKSDPYIILASAIPKKSKFETIIEKCTELGVNEIIPLMTMRTEIKLKDPSRISKKIERYKTVALNAAKQSQRTDIPIIHSFMSLNESIQYCDSKKMIKIIPSLLGKRRSLRNALQALKKTDPLVFFIGPEGDFTQKEYEEAHSKGCLPVTLGTTTLKVETAAITVVSFSKLFFV